MVLKTLFREDLKLGVDPINFVTVGNPFHVIAAEYKKRGLSNTAFDLAWNEIGGTAPSGVSMRITNP